MMEGTDNYKSCETIVNAALCLTKAFTMLKKKSHYFLYMTEDDLFIHPQSVRIIIANVEFLKKEEEPGGLWELLNVSRLFPPVCVRKERLPNERSNCYLLSVLLFEILYLSHPLEGRCAA